MPSDRPGLHQLYQHSMGSEDFHLVQTHATPERESGYVNMCVCRSNVCYTDAVGKGVLVSICYTQITV